MKRFLTGCVAIALVASFIGCSTGSSNDSSTATTPTTTDSSTGSSNDSSTATTPTTTDSTTKNVPSKLANDIPKSIQGTKSASSSVRSAARAAQTSTAYTEIRGLTLSMSSMEMMAGMYAIVADEIITQNSSLANAGEKDISVTLTQAMVDKITALMGGNDAIDVSSLKDSIGQTMTGKATYTTTGTGTYKYEIDVTTTEDNVAYTTKLYWSEDKKSAKLVLDQGTSGTVTFLYDGVDDQTSLIMTMSGIDMNMSIQTKGTGAVVLCFVKDTNGLYSMKGYADDKGGYITMSYTAASSGQTTSSSESFDADGNIIEDTSYQTSFSDAQKDGTVNASDMEGTDAYVVATELADGDYFAYMDDTLTESSFDVNKFVGSAYVASKYLAITPMNDTSATYLKTAGKTVYLYPITWAADGSSYTLGTKSTITTK